MGETLKSWTLGQMVLQEQEGSKRDERWLWEMVHHSTDGLRHTALPRQRGWWYLRSIQQQNKQTPLSLLGKKTPRWAGAFKVCKYEPTCLLWFTALSLKKMFYYPSLIYFPWIQNGLRKTKVKQEHANFQTWKHEKNTHTHSPCQTWASKYSEAMWGKNCNQFVYWGLGDR